MTHTPLTKAEREELQAFAMDRMNVTVYSGKLIDGALADIDAAEAERDEIKTALGVMGATRERALEVAGSQDELEERIDSMSRERDVALKGWSAAEAARDAAAAQRDRAESELDAERRMRVEAEAASDRSNSELATAQSIVSQSTARMEEMRAERDALKAQEGEWADQIAAALKSTADKLGRTPSMIAGHVRREHEAHTACFGRLRKAVDERDALKKSLRLLDRITDGKEPSNGTEPEDIQQVVERFVALKAKLDDPRRVVIHETEVVATKEEIATLKARLADLSDADEELHTCRALVNATSENLSVDLERMVDDLAEANEKAALSGKDSHSWHELYKDTKAKLAACEAERDAQATELVDERDRAKAKLAAAESAHSELFLSGQVAELRGKLAAVVAAYDHVFGDFDHSALSVDARILFDAIAAARGGAS